MNGEEHARLSARDLGGALWKGKSWKRSICSSTAMARRKTKRREAVTAPGTERSARSHALLHASRTPRRNMICSAKCSCFLCRELQSCRTDTRKFTDTANMCDNFILKKAEAFEGSSAMKFIRGAARLSVRHWQNKETFTPTRSRPTALGVGKSTSCEQLYPFDRERGIGVKRTPSTENVTKVNNFEHKPLFRILGNSRLKKFNNSDSREQKTKRSVLNFRKNESASHVHEKYIPIPQISSPILNEHVYSEPKQKDSLYDRCWRPPAPIYQCVEKNRKREEDSPGRTSNKFYSNRPPCYEELARKLSQDKNKFHPPLKESVPSNKITQNNNKVVIYFGDSIVRKHSNEARKSEKSDLEDHYQSRTKEVIYANRLLEETANLGLNRGLNQDGENNKLANLISEVSVANEEIYSEIGPSKEATDRHKDVGNIKNATYRKEEKDLDLGGGGAVAVAAVSSDGVIHVEFKENFECARKWVDIISGRLEDYDEATILEQDEEAFDWSFIQGWRKRPSNGCRPYEDPPTSHMAQLKQVPAIASSAATALLQPSKASRVRIPNPGHHRLSKDLSLSPERAYITHAHAYPKSADSQGSTVAIAHYASDDIVIKNGYGPMMATPLKASGPQLKSVTAPSKITVQSTPVKCQNPMNSYGLERTKEAPPPPAGKERRAGVGAESSPPPHQHASPETITPLQIVPRDCGSSSDENRSSGHASMSDSGGGGVEARGEAGGRGDGEESRARSRASSNHARARHRQQNNKLQSPWPGGGGLEDIRSAIKQLTLRSRDSTSTTSATSSATGSATGSAAGDSARRRRAPLVRQPSLDTVCTNVTSADEFVWVDSHNRLVELQLVPWSAGEVTRSLSSGRCRDHAARLSPDTPPRLAYMLQRALVRVAREAQRLSHNFGFCSKHEVAGAFRIVLSTTLADACIKGCQRAGTMFAMSGDAALRQSKAARANTQLSPGKFHRWMVDMRLAPFVHEYAAIYLCAGMETLLEEILMLAVTGTTGQLTPVLLETAIANSAELWGLLQPYAHLNAGRIASGALSLSRWASLSSLGSGGSTNSNHKEGNKLHNQLGLSHDSGITTNGSGGSGSSGTGSGSGSARSVLLTTCVGSACELRAVLRRAPPPHPHPTAANAPPLSPHALHALYYFMRCSQLEHSNSSSVGGSSACQELWYERAYGVLPPLGEWLRVAAAHAELRGACAIDRDDVQQAARLLLPGVDCAPRPLTMEEPLEPRRGTGKFSSGSKTPAAEESARASVALAHRLLLTGRAELVSAARALLPSTGLDTVDHNGLTVLMKAAVAGDEHCVAMLLEAGADPNVESPGCTSQHALLLSPRSAAPPAAAQPQAASPQAPTTAGWTALVYAAAGGGAGAVACCARLLAGAARVEGAAGRSDDVCTLTPLQVACGTGNVELVQMLLQHGANPFLSTLLKDSLCYSGSAQRGCYSAISVCCAHGQRACLRAVLAHPVGAARGADVLSLEEILAEGAPAPAPAPALAAYTKSQLRSLQEAMYHAAETNHLDITLELRALGVAWTLHAWMLSLAAAADAAAENIIDQLLQDFLQVCPSDDSHYSRTFIYDCLPLLFNILRYSKKEGTILLLADILCACYGWEAVPAVREPPPPAQLAARIDPSFVNNPELSDVTFRVEGRLFYGHKIVLVTESPRFRAMLASPPRGSDSSAASSPAQSDPGPPPAAASAAQPPIVQINDIRYHIFQQVMKFLYCGGCSTLDIPDGDVLEVLAAASFFQLLPLQRHCEARAARALALHNLVSVYIHAKVYNAQQLLEYCQGFLLQNMVALLTYDESVKRLLFGKRLPGHNVLSALLHTLQLRIEARKNTAKSSR